MTLLKIPKYDHRSQSWKVMNEAGEARRFDTEYEAEEFYNQHMPEELR